MTVTDVLADMLADFPPLGEWVAEAACGALLSPEVFTADRRPDPDELAIAERVCRRCPVWQECADYAASTPVWGVWGGVWHNGRVRVVEAA